ncbi:MAG: bifunctional glycosyltransferase family 2/GtrA family protein [Clostridia bacterium]
MKKIVAILPSLNPDKNLKEVVNTLVLEGFENILVINDGSDEKYDKYFNELMDFPECTLLKHEVNQGKGEALKTAFRHFKENFSSDEFAGVVTADADGQHLAKDIKKCAESMLENPNSLIFGVRDFNEEHVPPKSRIGNKTTTQIIKLLFGKKIIDTQTGLRGINYEHIDIFLEEQGSRFEYEINMLICALNMDINIVQVPIETVYYENNRQTHFNPIKDSIKIYKVILASFFRYIVVAFVCFFIDQGLFNIFLFFANIASSTFFSRIISAIINFKLNKDYVFKNKNVKDNSLLIKYAVLCVVQMVLSATATTVLFNLTKNNVSIIKILVDLCLFVINYIIQKLYIFKGERK